MGNKIMYSVRLDSEIVRKLKVLAEKENYSVSDIVRRELHSKFPIRMEGIKNE